MKTPTSSVWWLRIATFSVAALAAASAAYWVLKWSAGAPAAPGLAAAASSSRSVQSDPQLVARLLGGGQKAIAVALSDSAASRFKLMGVAALGASRGYALISVDGKPARPYGVGAAVNDSLVVRSVAPRSADLASRIDAPTSFTLELPIPSASGGKAAPAAAATTPAQAAPAPTPALAPAPPVANEAAPARSARKAARVNSSSD